MLLMGSSSLYASQPRANKKHAFLQRCLWIHLLPQFCGKHERHVDVVLELLVFLCAHRPVIRIHNALLELLLLLLIKMFHFFHCVRRLCKTLIIDGFLIHIVLQFLKFYGKKAGFAHCEGIHPLQAVVSPAQPCLEFGVIKKFVSVCLFRFFASPYQCWQNMFFEWYNA